jgi:hypothetical protein
MRRVGVASCRVEPKGLQILDCRFQIGPGSVQGSGSGSNIFGLKICNLRSSISDPVILLESKHPDTLLGLC